MNGASVDYSYDVMNRLASVKDNGLPIGANTTTYTYDDVSNLHSYTYPNAVTTSFGYSSLNRLTALTVSNGPINLAAYNYTPGAAGNRLSVTEQNGRSVNYTYDSLYRLTNETITGAIVSAQNGSISYGYDAVGNRLSRTSNLGAVPSTTNAYDDNDRLTSDGYDNNGNTITAIGTTYAYDFENRLNTVNGRSVSFVYDGDGNRVARSVNGVTTRYLIDTNNPTGYAQVIDEIRDNQVSRTYTYGHSLISQRQLINSQRLVSFCGHDGHAGVRMLTDLTGATTDTYTYDAFGNLIAATGNTPNERLYAGEQFDANIGFYYLRARYLNPSSGRFWTADSYEGNSYDPAFLHKYLYVGADPANKVDGGFNLKCNFEISG
jgi:RHS repeat-associated protein